MAFADVVRSPKFWLFTLSFGLFYFGCAATMGQLVPILGGIGIPAEQAIALQGVMAISVMVGRLAAGHLLDRFFAATSISPLASSPRPGS